MYVNGGQRGLNLRLAPQDLLAVTGASSGADPVENPASNCTLMPVVL